MAGDWIKVEKCTARKPGMDSEAVLAVITEYETNRSKFDGPGAIADRVRSGAWPVSGIRGKFDQELQSLPGTKARAEELKQREAMGLVRELRRQKKSNEEIKTELNARFPAAVVKAVGIDKENSLVGLATIDQAFQSHQVEPAERLGRWLPKCLVGRDR